MFLSCTGIDSSLDLDSYAERMTPSTTPEQLEQDLRTAQLHGRWLSDDELAALQDAREQRIQAEERRDHLRLRLLVRTGVCLLSPPLWPLALGLTLYLLFPATTRRVGFAAGLLLLAAAIGTTGLAVMLTIWLISVLF